MPRKRRQTALKGDGSTPVQSGPCKHKRHLPAAISDLPPELLALVLTFLPIKECLLTTDLVSQPFHHASKHPMHWDGPSSLTLNNDLQVAEAVKFFTKNHCTPNLRVELLRLSRASFRMLAPLNALRVLTLDCVSPANVFGVSDWLSSLSQLENLTAWGASGHERFHTFVFPTMPRLKTLDLGSPPLRTIINMDTAHLPLLSTLTISCDNLQTSSFPDSLVRLTLNVWSCSAQVLTNISNIPNLQFLVGDVAATIISQPNLRFASTLTTLSLESKLTSQARDNLRRMTNLSALDVEGAKVSAEDVEAIASLPSLTDFQATEFKGSLFDRSLAPLRHAASLKRLRVEAIPPSSLPYFAHPSLTYLALDHCPFITSLAPLAACVNLTALHADVCLSEPDAEMLSGLTKLEKLGVIVSTERCFMCICRLRCLKLLRIYAPCVESNFVRPAALQALAGLAPTIEKLALPRLADTQATVLVVSKLKKLDYFHTHSTLTPEQVSALRDSLPRLRVLIHKGVRDRHSYLSIDSE